MTEYFAFLFDFARSGMDQCLLIIKHGTIAKCSKFYLENRRPQKLTGQKKIAETLAGKQLKSQKTEDEVIIESDSSKGVIKENVLKKVNHF